MEPLRSPSSADSDLRPRQSWEVAGDLTVGCDAAAPLLVVQRLPAVVRVDSCRRLNLQQAAMKGGSVAKLAERMLPELAYKLGRAPKYGA